MLLPHIDPLTLVTLFYQHGYVIVKGLFSEDEIHSMKNAVTRLKNVADTYSEDTETFNSKFIINPKNKMCSRVIWAGGIEPILLRYGQDKRMLFIVSHLLRSEVLIHILNQVHFKTPNDGSGYPLHQDIWNRDKQDGTYTDINGHGSFIQSMIAIDKMDQSNGGIYFLPKSHLYKRVTQEEVNNHKLVDINQSIALNLDVGDVAFWSPYLIHGSSPNTSNKSRNSLINGYCLMGANRRAYSGCGIGQSLIFNNSGIVDQKTLDYIVKLSQNESW